MNPVFDSGGFDDGDVEISGWHQWIRLILFLPALAVTLFFYMISEDELNRPIWEWMNLWYPINPFSTGNYAHAFAEHWEWQPEEQYNRWNLP